MSAPTKEEFFSEENTVAHYPAQQPSNPPKEATNMKDKELRDILNCTCSYNETYDGKAYNLKTEAYEDCSCVEAIPRLTQYNQASVLEARKHDHEQMLIARGWDEDSEVGLIQISKDPLDRLIADTLMEIEAELAALKKGQQ